MNLDDNKLIELYGMWSEAFYAAGFIEPIEETVQQFRKWLHSTPPYKQLFSYEQEMLDEYHKQEDLG